MAMCCPVKGEEEKLHGTSAFDVFQIDRVPQAHPPVDFPKLTAMKPEDCGPLDARPAPRAALYNYALVASFEEAADAIDTEGQRILLKGRVRTLVVNVVLASDRSTKVSSHDPVQLELRCEYAASGEQVEDLLNAQLPASLELPELQEPCAWLEGGQCRIAFKLNVLSSMRHSLFQLRVQPRDVTLREWFPNLACTTEPIKTLTKRPPPLKRPALEYRADVEQPMRRRTRRASLSITAELRQRVAANDEKISELEAESSRLETALAKARLKALTAFVMS